MARIRNFEDVFSVKEEFPLALWKDTLEYRVLHDSQMLRLNCVVSLLESHGFKYLGMMPRLEPDEGMVVWVNTFSYSGHLNRPTYAMAGNLLYGKEIRGNEGTVITSRTKLDDVLSAARKYIESGWYTIGELEELSEGKGRAVEKTMWTLGWKRSESGRSWRKLESADFRKSFERDGPAGPQPIPPENIAGEELDRLNSLWVLPNNNLGLGKTYGITVSNSGLIYAYFMVDLFPEKDSDFIRGIMLNDWISSSQAGFKIDAKKVILGKEKGVYLKATRENGSFVECVWPSYMPVSTDQTPDSPDNLLYLASDLVSRVNSS